MPDATASGAKRLPPAPAEDEARRAEWALRLLIALSVLGPLALLAVLSWQKHRDVHREARAHINYTLELLHEHAQRVFETYDLVLKRVSDRVATLAWERIRTEEKSVHDDLKAIMAGIEQVGNLILVDPSGRLSASTGAFPTPRLDNSDRDYFRVHREAEIGVFVDRAVTGRVTGRKIFNVSKRRSGPDGAFQGSEVRLRGDGF